DPERRATWAPLPTTLLPAAMDPTNAPFISASAIFIFETLFHLRHSCQFRKFDATPPLRHGRGVRRWPERLFAGISSVVAEQKAAEMVAAIASEDASEQCGCDTRSRRVSPWWHTVSWLPKSNRERLVVPLEVLADGP